MVNIFITGVTGFIGTVLLGKLLSDATITQYSKIYCLIRNKRGVHSQQRKDDLVNKLKGWNVMISDDLFDKIHIIHGDILEDRLGVESLPADIHVVVNLAASISFTLPVADAAKYNISGVMALMEHMKSLPDLQSFIHVSTMYINQFNTGYYNDQYNNDYDKYTYDELYNCYQECLQGNMPRLLQSNGKRFINTYCLTKWISDGLINKRYNGNNNTPPCNVTIMRPSIVTASESFPTPGYVANLSVSTGFYAAILADVQTVFNVDNQNAMDMIPVDHFCTNIVDQLHCTINDSNDAFAIKNCTSLRIPIIMMEKLINVKRSIDGKSNVLLTKNKIYSAVYYFFLSNCYYVASNVLKNKDAGRAYRAIGSLQDVVEFGNTHFYFHTDNTRLDDDNFDVKQYLRNYYQYIDTHFLKNKLIKNINTPSRLSVNRMLVLVAPIIAMIILIFFRYIKLAIGVGIIMVGTMMIKLYQKRFHRMSIAQSILSQSIPIVNHTILDNINIDTSSLFDAIDSDYQGYQRVYCMNHSTYYDFLLFPFILYKFSRLNLPLPRIMASPEFAKVPVLNTFLRNAGAVYLKRKKDSSESIETINQHNDQIIKDVLSKDDLLFFPEGTRSRTTELYPIKTGVFKSIQKLEKKVVVIPITITHEKRIDNDELYKESIGIKKGKMSILKVMSWMVKCMRNKVNAGNINVKFGKSFLFNHHSDLSVVTNTLVERFQTNKIITNYHLEGLSDQAKQELQQSSSISYLDTTTIPDPPSQDKHQQYIRWCSWLPFVYNYILHNIDELASTMNVTKQQLQDHLASKTFVKDDLHLQLPIATKEYISMYV